MNPLQHKTKAKLVAAILVFYLLAFFTLSLAYEVKEAHHLIFHIFITVFLFNTAIPNIFYFTIVHFKFHIGG